MITIFFKTPSAIYRNILFDVTNQLIASYQVQNDPYAYISEACEFDEQDISVSSMIRECPEFSIKVLG